MKKIIIILTIIGLLFFGGLIFAAKNIDRIIATAKPTIESGLTSAIGGTLSIGDIKTSVFPETAVRINTIKVENSSLVPNITVDSVALKVSFSSLLKGDLNVHELTVSKPKIDLSSHKPEQSKSDSKKVDSKTSTNPDKNSGQKNDSSLTDLPITFNLHRLSIEGGTILNGTQNTIVSDLDVNTGAKFESGIASIDRLKITARVSSNPISVEMSNGSFNPASGQIKTTGLAVDVAGARVNLDSDFNKQTFISQTNLNISANTLSNFFNLLTSIKPDFSAPPVEISKINFPIIIKSEGLNFTAQSSESKLSLSNSEVVSSFDINATTSDIITKKFDASAFGGTITCPFEFNIPDSSIKAPLQIKSINIEPALNAVAPQLPVKLFGTIVDLHGTIGGSFKSNIIASSNGNLQFLINNGGIRGINIVGKIIDALATIPVIGDALKTKLAPSVLAVASSEDTTFTTLTGSTNISKGVANLSNVQLDSELFKATSSGNFNLNDKSMMFNVTANLKPELVKNLIAAGKDFEKVTNPDGTITVPLIIKSDSNGMQVIPDLDKLAKGAVGKVLKEQAGKALQKVFGGKDSSGAKNIGKLFGF
jgi:hypothetical protein